jgi:hypothetical protein
MLLLALALTAVVLMSCYPDYGLSVEEYDVVVTIYDSLYNFGAIQTYAMPDSVVYIYDTTKGDEPTHKYDSLILKTIEEEMTAIGYTRTTDTAAADILVFATATSVDVYAVYGGCYGGCYWYWYYPGCGWCYPWYGGGVYSYSIGSLLIDMVDKPEPSADDSPAHWNAGLNGYLTGSGTSGASRVERGIRQAFRQSPYLGAVTPTP